MKTAFNFILAVLLLTALPLTLSAEMYKVLRWCGNVKIAGKKLLKTNPFPLRPK